MKVATNLGRAASDLTIEDGILTEIYVNGDRVCSDKSLRASTRVEYSCAKQPQVTALVRIVAIYSPLDVCIGAL